MSKIIVDQIDSLSGGNIIANKKIEGIEPTNDQELATKKYVDDNVLNPNDFYLKTEFIDSSTGGADAGKPVVLDSAGQLDSSMVTVDSSLVDHTLIQNIGTNSHTQIDSHISSTANPHSVTSAQIGAYNTSEFIDTTTGAGDAGKPIKTEAAGLVDSSFLPISTTSQVGVAEIATQAESDLGRDEERIITPRRVQEGIQLQSYATLCSVSGLTTTITAGSSLNLLSLFALSDESLRKETYFNLRDTSNSLITNLLDATNDKFVFPSNLNTFNKDYKGYIIRVNTTADYAGAAGATEEYNFRIRRVVDNSIIDTRVLPRVELDSVTGVNRGVLFQTFVNTETDPYVLDGMYIDILVPTGGLDITLTSLSILIQTI